MQAYIRIFSGVDLAKLQVEMNRFLGENVGQLISTQHAPTALKNGMDVPYIQHHFTVTYYSKRDIARQAEDAARLV